MYIVGKLAERYSYDKALISHTPTQTHIPKTKSKFNFIKRISIKEVALFVPHHEKICFFNMQKQRHISAV